MTTVRPGWVKALVLAVLVGAGATLAGLWLYGARPWQGEAAAPNAPIPFTAGQTASRIAILGTSLTARGNWAEMLRDELRKCNPKAGITALAKPGANSAWGLATFLAEPSRFDIVITEFSINDASLFHGMPLFQSRDRHARILAAISDAGAVPVLATMSPAWGREAWERPGQASYRQMYRDLGESGVALIDTTAEWREIAGQERVRLIPDNLHPTPEAMQRITVPAFLSALRPAVCGLPG